MNKYDTYIEFNGKSFKDTYPNKKFYMVTNKPEKFGGCKIVDGINIMKNKESYFEFTDQENIIDYIDEKNSVYIREVTIMPNSIVYIKKYGQYCTNTFFLKHKVKINESELWCDARFCKIIIENNKENDRYKNNILNNIATKDYAIKKMVLEKYPDTFSILNDQTTELCDIAIKLDYKNIKYVKTQTPEQAWFSLRNDVKLFRYIVNPTNEMIIFAVASDIKNIKYVKNITNEMHLMLTQICKNTVQPICCAVDGMELGSDVDEPNIEQTNDTDFVTNINAMLNSVKTLVGKMNRKKKTLEIFDKIITNLDFLEKRPSFKTTVINKLAEFKNNNDYCDYEYNYYMDIINK